MSQHTLTFKVPKLIELGNIAKREITDRPVLGHNGHGVVFTKLLKIILKVLTKQPKLSQSGMGNMGKQGQLNEKIWYRVV